MPLGRSLNTTFVKGLTDTISVKDVSADVRVTDLSVSDITGSSDQLAGALSGDFNSFDLGIAFQDWQAVLSGNSNSTEDEGGVPFYLLGIEAEKPSSSFQSLALLNNPESSENPTAQIFEIRAESTNWASFRVPKDNLKPVSYQRDLQIRWNNGFPFPVVDLESEDYWTRDYPGILTVLSDNLALLEKKDLDWLGFVLSSFADSVSDLFSAAHKLGEIVGRSRVVEAYKKALEEHPNAVLVLPYQFRNPSNIHDASAAIGEFVTEGGTLKFRTYSVWKFEYTVASSSTAIVGDTAVFVSAPVYAPDGRLFFDSGLEKNIVIPISAPDQGIEVHTLTVVLDSDLFHLTTNKVLRKLAEPHSVRLRNGQRVAAPDCESRVLDRIKSLIEMAKRGFLTKEEFASILGHTDYKTSLIFYYMFETDKPRREIVTRLLSGMTAAAMNRRRAMLLELAKARGWKIERSTEATVSTSFTVVETILPEPSSDEPARIPTTQVTPSLGEPTQQWAHRRGRPPKSLAEALRTAREEEQRREAEAKVWVDGLITLLDQKYPDAAALLHKIFDRR